MKAMLSKLLYKKCIIYINNIIVFEFTFDKHLKNIKEVLAWLRKYNIIVKPSKCKFCQKEIEYLEHRVGNSKLIMLSENRKFETDSKESFGEKQD